MSQHSILKFALCFFQKWTTVNQVVTKARYGQVQEAASSVWEEIQVYQMWRGFRSSRLVKVLQQSYKDISNDLSYVT